MPPHPNRSRLKTAAANPKPEAIIAMRKQLDLTQRAAAEMVFSSVDAWQDWEAGRRRMHPALWQLFEVKASTLAGIAQAVIEEMALMRAGKAPVNAVARQIIEQAGYATDGVTGT